MSLTTEDIQRIREEETERAKVRRELYKSAPKEMWLAVILTLVFGPLGLFYVDTRKAWIVMGISLVVTLITLGILFWVGWVLAVIVAIAEVSKQNK